MGLTHGVLRGAEGEVVRWLRWLGMHGTAAAQALATASRQVLASVVCRAPVGLQGPPLKGVGRMPALRGSVSPGGMHVDTWLAGQSTGWGTSALAVLLGAGRCLVLGLVLKLAASALHCRARTFLGQAQPSGTCESRSPGMTCLVSSRANQWATLQQGACGSLRAGQQMPTARVEQLS